MKLVCAWCGDNIDRPKYKESLDPNTSHGMCRSCSQALATEESGSSLQRHIDSIPIPIVLLDCNDAVVSMNAEACEMLGKTVNETASQPWGRVFDCAHSHLREGCGRTIHCSGCAIRRSVARTFDTGEPQILVPATLTLQDADRISNAVLTITTVKSNGLVLLLIDKHKAS